MKYFTTPEAVARAIATKAAQDKYRLEHPLPPPSPEVQRVMENDAARHAAYDRDDVELHDITAADDFADAMAWDAEQDELERTGNAPEFLPYVPPEET